MPEADFVRHEACRYCTSSDAASVYSSGWVHCFSCGKNYKEDGTVSEEKPKVKQPLIPAEEIEIKEIASRGISRITSEKFNYGFSTYNRKRCHVAPYYTPDGKLVAQKIRFPNKDFTITGDLSEAGLFGQHLWKSSGKQVVITEGEIDAMSVSQIFGNKWPVASVPTGAKGAFRAIQKNLEWLLGFESIILMFDNDEEGQKAARECAELFPPNRCKIAVLPLKDASDMLQAGRVDEVNQCVWQARTFHPEDILTGDQVWEVMQQMPPDDVAEYKWPGLNSMLLGARQGELILITGGTGGGKSEFVGHTAHYLLTHHGQKVGYFGLEENAGETGYRLLSVELGERLLLNRDAVDYETKREAFAKFKDNLYVYNHFGTTDPEGLANKIRYLVRGVGVQNIFLDHISIVVSGMVSDNERKDIDLIMTRLATLVQELRCRLFVVCHLRKPNGDGSFENGEPITMDDLRGSATLKQLPWDIIALERDQQDHEKKAFTTARVLKCRRTGRTGVAAVLKYNEKTGALDESNEYFEESPITT